MARSPSPSEPYLTCKRICFVLVCIAASVLNIAILCYRSKLVQLYDLAYPTANQDLVQMASQKERYLEILHDTPWTNLICSSMPLFDLSPDQFWFKLPFLCLISLSTISPILFLVQVSAITFDFIELVTYYLLCAELLLLLLYMTFVFSRLNLYFQLMDRWASSSTSGNIDNPPEESLALSSIEVVGHNSVQKDTSVNEGNEKTIASH